MRGSLVEVPQSQLANPTGQKFSRGLSIERRPRKGDFYLTVCRQNVASQAAFAARLTRMLRRSEVHGRGSCNLTLRGCREAVGLAFPIAEERRWHRRAPQLREGCLLLFSATNLTIAESQQCAELLKTVIDTAKPLLERRGTHVGFLAIVQGGIYESVSTTAPWKAIFLVLPASVVWSTH
jgi:hypothetical protein